MGRVLDSARESGKCSFSENLRDALVDSLIGSLHLRFRRVDFLQIDRKLFALADESRSAVFSFLFFAFHIFPAVIGDCYRTTC